MNDKERQELAADIARRVRMYAWQGLSREQLRMFGDSSWNWQVSLPGNRFGTLLRVTYHHSLPRLELEFIGGANGETIQRFAFTPED